MISAINSGMQTPVNISAVVMGLNLSGTGELSGSKAVNATFEGQPSISITRSFNGTFSQGNVSLLINDVVYFDSNYNELGYVRHDNDDLFHDSYIIINTRGPLPSAAKVGDAGQLYTATAYSDQTKTAVLHVDTSTYMVDADAATSIIFHITTKFNDATGALKETEEWRYRVSSAGSVTFVSLDIVVADGSMSTHIAAQ
jgi:hypothetical protein